MPSHQLVAQLPDQWDFRYDPDEVGEKEGQFGQQVSDVFTHHRSVSSCHLCNIGMLLGRKLRWDPANERFVGDDEANQMLSRDIRSPWQV